MSISIRPIDIHSFHPAVMLVMRFMQEHKGMMVNRIEAENILKDTANKTYVLIVNHEIRGVYVYEDGENVYTVKVFVLDPLVRTKKTGYALWEHIKTHLKDKPALIGIMANNKKIASLIKKRGKYLGSYLDEDGDVLEYYNLSFQELKGNKQ